MKSAKWKKRDVKFLTFSFDDHSCIFFHAYRNYVFCYFAVYKKKVIFPCCERLKMKNFRSQTNSVEINKTSNIISVNNFVPETCGKRLPETEFLD